MTPNGFGIVFDIDGVLYRGGSLITGAKTAIEEVMQLGIPHLFFTNNGMETEAMRAERLGKQMELHLSPEKFILCHKAAQIGEGLVLVTGFCLMDSIELMKALGFKNVHTIDAYAARHPKLYPLKSYPAVVDRVWADAPVEMIVLLETNLEWSQDIQIICDLMLHGGYPSPRITRERPQPKLIGCNFDLTYMAAHETARLGPGAFVEALSLIYHKVSRGETLEFIKHGKPHGPMYRLAEQRLQKQLPHSHLRRIYAIGDNPQSDIRGANNAGGIWTSILVRTGCFQGHHNDLTDPADYVVQDVTEAVQLILQLETASSLN